ncbi:universal stress protein [Actinoallomurus sp. NPDC052308]|uniref:universal stress protein n=1 Tax=Actinoallomurus sp. NPDC052308 TaxID=3155530 RepID=UPI0034273D6C
MANEHGENQDRIVVGVDGSEPSRAALRWALRQARLTGAAVDAVIGWEVPTSFGWDMAVVGADDIKAAAAKTLEATIEQEAGQRPEVPVDARVMEGNAARVLLDAAEGADLIVVGNRGHGGFTGALLGSVSQHCVHHAKCPVVVIRGEHRS